MGQSGMSFLRHLVKAQDVLARFYDLQGSSDTTLREAANLVKAEIFTKGTTAEHPLETLGFTLQALMNLYYPTDDSGVTALQYFRQREWRIFPNVAHNGQWLFPDLTSDEKDVVRAVNPTFWNQPLGGKQLVDFCLKYDEVDRRRIVREAKRIIVPDKFVDAVERIVAETKTTLTVTPLSTIPTEAPKAP